MDRLADDGQPESLTESHSDPGFYLCGLSAPEPSSTHRWKPETLRTADLTGRCHPHQNDVINSFTQKKVGILREQDTECVGFDGQGGRMWEAPPTSSPEPHTPSRVLLGIQTRVT
ncbi:hypothetical protein P7K49_020739 [Saguinus oedipus]|uniref:Uncharacterized protein n=1 Tax=Saguinus oedipus TaxID=9490 RepID=A0ABQ9UQM6_SAGOE|nr:hypothetical protein P7K49_020739 [Saguinus oedipus]